MSDPLELNGMTAEDFDLVSYLIQFDQDLLECAEGRRILTKYNPLLFALLYLRHHLVDKNETTDANGKYLSKVKRTVRLADCHIEWCRLALDWVKPASTRHSIIAPRETGKACTLDTMIPTPRGWTTMKDINIGDDLFDESGNICQVIAKSEIWKDSTYRVEFGDGSHVDVHENHEWDVVDNRNKEKYNSSRVGRRGKRIGGPYDWREYWDLHKTVTTKFMYKSLRYGARGDLRWRVPNAKPLNLPDKPLPIDPYLLGFWLGDGHSANGVITVNREDYEEIKDRLSIHTVQPCGDQPKSLRINITGLIGRLRALNLLNNKHIPIDYLRASIIQRKELVRGLMDSDGYSGTSGAANEISLNNEHLANDVLELFRTLGLSATLTKNDSKLYGVKTGIRHRVRANFDFNPYHLSRYSWIPPQNSRSTARTIKSITEIAPRETQCITVNSTTHLYLTGDAMIPTHNSTWWFLILPIWAAAHGHIKFAVAFSSAATQAQGHLKSIKKELDLGFSLLWNDYPELCEPLKRPRGQTVSDNVAMFQTKSNFAFAAKGIDTSTLGLKVGDQRPDLIILDDIEPGESNYSAAEVEKRLITVRDDILPLGYGAKVVWPGYTTMVDSLVHQMVRSAQGDESAEWIKALDMKVHYYPPVIIDDDGERASFWPSRWSLEYLDEQKRINPYGYAKNFENDPADNNGMWWRKEDIRYHNLERYDRVVLIVDGAVTVKKTSDFTGLSVVGLDVSGRRFYVREAIGVKQSGEELRDTVLKLVEEYEVLYIMVEANQGGDLWHMVFHDMPVKIDTFRQAEKKEYRIRRLLAAYQRAEGAVFHEKQLPQLERQQLAYPNVQHEDILDATAAGVEHLTHMLMRALGKTGNKAEIKKLTLRR